MLGRYPRADMTAAPEPTLEDSIIRNVIEILESEGYRAVVLREVARRARVSLSTIYKLFPTCERLLPTREELIVRAIERWITDEYPVGTPPSPAEPLYNRLMSLIHYILGPWQRNPRMLEALDRARGGPAEHRLTPKISEAVRPVRNAAFAGCDPEFVADVELILGNLIDALIRKFTDGQMKITAILPTLERVVFRLSLTPPMSTVPARNHRTRKPRDGRVAASGELHQEDLLGH